MASSWGRAALGTVLVIVAVAFQVVVLARLPLPGATPDLVLVIVVAWALKRGSLEGAVIGFGAGLALDVAPPATGTLGLSALVLCLVGYAAGLASADAERSAAGPLVVVGIAAAAEPTLYALLGALTGDGGVTWSALGGQLPTQVLYTLVLAPFVLPMVQALLRRLEPAVVRW